ncbi:hypothetical protein BC628DRAFT_122727 [Trametes gibbosa]|nr:hypothetical protein BC628DRAFT_122727 [Trametes gibbosa]
MDEGEHSFLMNLTQSSASYCILVSTSVCCHTAANTRSRVLLSLVLRHLRPYRKIALWTSNFYVNRRDYAFATRCSPTPAIHPLPRPPKPRDYAQVPGENRPWTSMTSVRQGLDKRPEKGYTFSPGLQSGASVTTSPRTISIIPLHIPSSIFSGVRVLPPHEVTLEVIIFAFLVAMSG